MKVRSKYCSFSQKVSVRPSILRSSVRRSSDRLPSVHRPSVTEPIILASKFILSWSTSINTCLNGIYDHTLIIRLYKYTKMGIWLKGESNYPPMTQGLTRFVLSSYTVMSVQQNQKSSICYLFETQNRHSRLPNFL